jgi:two-component system sensor histidine kinase KdpD
VATACAQALARLFKAPAVVLFAGDGGLEPAAAAGGARLSPADREAAGWAIASRLPTRGGVYPVDEAEYDFWPVFSPQRQDAVIGVKLSGRDEGRPTAPERLVEIVSGYLTVALDREEYARQGVAMQVEIASERLKTDLLAAVSHDLKTPLSTILVALQSLQKFGKAHDAKDRAELLTLAETETARLSAMVVNLLDSNRLEAGALVVRAAPVPPAGLVAEAMTRAAPALAGRDVVNEVAPAEQPLMVDAALFESALANVLENAGKYAPAHSTIRVRGGADDGMGWIEVLDEGPGFPDAVEPIFEKFTRGVEGDGRPAGIGLGLAIARGFLEAQGGRVEPRTVGMGRARGFG